MVLISVMLAMSVGGGTGGQAVAERTSFGIALSVPLSTVSLGARIPCIVTMTNVSSHVIVWGGGERIAELGLETERLVGVMVYDAEGKRVPETEYGRLIYGRRFKSGGGKAMCCSNWQSGEGIMEESDLNREFDLSKPGSYTVIGQRLDKESKSIVESNRVSFQVVAGVRGAQTSAPSFTLEAAMPATPIPAGSSIPLTTTVTNTSTYDVPILVEYRRGFPDQVRGRIAVEVVDAQGQPVPRTEYGESIRLEPGYFQQRGPIALTLKPAGTYREEADLGKAFELQAPGTYTVEAQKRDQVSGAIIRSNKITFRVVR
jgi:hypothetical protein